MYRRYTNVCVSMFADDSYFGFVLPYLFIFLQTFQHWFIAITTIPSVTYLFITIPISLVHITITVETSKLFDH